MVCDFPKVDVYRSRSEGRLASRSSVRARISPHIAATVNTLFLAYVSVGLPLLIVLFVSHQPSGAVLNDETIATEIVRTLIGSLGIIAAIPLTTFIAGLLVAPQVASAAGAGVPRPQPVSRPGHGRRDHRPAHRDDGRLAPVVTARRSDPERDRPGSLIRSWPVVRGLLA